MYHRCRLVPRYPLHRSSRDRLPQCPGQDAGLRQKLFLHLLNHGIYVGNKIVGNISVPMEREELDSFMQVWESFYSKCGKRLQ